MLACWKPLLVLFSAWTAASFNDSPSCCFSLSAVDDRDNIFTVKQNKAGGLRLNSRSQQAFFCLDAATRALRDGVGNNCFIQQSTHKFQCFRGIPSPNDFSLDGKTVTYDGESIFQACPSAGPSSDKGSLELFSREHEAPGCYAVRLEHLDANDECLNPSPRILTTSSRRSINAARHRPTSAGTPEEKCQIVPRSTIIPPNRVGVGRWNEPFYVNPDGNATIAGTQGTLFEFTMRAGDFLHHADGYPRTCAVQFRLPYCTQLPAGYPCFQWSGLEQQRLAGAGMYFWHVFDSHAGDAEWEPVELVQLEPGVPSFAGTFKCLVDMDRSTRNVSFVAMPSNGWSLRFAQGGVGRQAGTRFGVGAYLVGCNSDLDEGKPRGGGVLDR